MRDSVHQGGAGYSSIEEPGQIIRNWGNREINRRMGHGTNQELIQFHYSA